MSGGVMIPVGDEMEQVILQTLAEDHSCLHHAGPMTGPCRTCRRRTAKLLSALQTLAVTRWKKPEPEPVAVVEVEVEGGVPTDTEDTTGLEGDLR